MREKKLLKVKTGKCQNLLCSGVGLIHGPPSLYSYSQVGILVKVIFFMYKSMYLLVSISRPSTTITALNRFPPPAGNYYLRLTNAPHFAGCVGDACGILLSSFRCLMWTLEWCRMVSRVRDAPWCAGERLCTIKPAGLV